MNRDVKREIRLQIRSNDKQTQIENYRPNKDTCQDDKARFKQKQRNNLTGLKKFLFQIESF